MKTMSLNEFWKSLRPTERDELRDELAKVTFVINSTVNAYGYGSRPVPVKKRRIVGEVIKRRHQVNVTF